MGTINHYLTGNNVEIGDNVEIGKNVRIGHNSIIYDNVVIGHNTVIASNSVIGEPTNDFYFRSDYLNKKTIVGEDSIIRSFSILYSGVQTGSGFQTGHRATIREGTIFGDFCSVGTSSDIQGYSQFGDYCRLHSNIFVAQFSKFGNFVFVYPNAVITNDPTPPSNKHKGVTVGDFSQIAAKAIILPGIVIGKHSLIGAAAKVTRDVGDYSLTAGDPATHIKDIREVKNKETGESHYPWPHNFERNMPWKGKNFDSWYKDSKYFNQ